MAAKEKLEREYEEIQRLKGNYDKVKIDPFEQERRRRATNSWKQKKNCARRAPRRVCRLMNTVTARSLFGLDWRDRNVRPDRHAALVFGAASQDFAVTTKEQIDLGDDERAPASPEPVSQQAAAERRRAEMAPEGESP